MTKVRFRALPSEAHFFQAGFGTRPQLFPSGPPGKSLGKGLGPSLQQSDFYSVFQKPTFCRQALEAVPQLFPSEPFGKSLGKAWDLDGESQSWGIAIRSTLFQAGSGTRP